MFPKTIYLFRNIRYSSVLFLLILLLTACTPAPAPHNYLLFFTEITVSPDPLIGQVATLHLEFISDYDQPVATVDIDLPEGIQLVKGDLNWKGSLTAHQPQTHDISICAEFQRVYSIGINGNLWTAEGDGLFTSPRYIYLDVSQTHAQVAEYSTDLIRPTNTNGPTMAPTALPQDWVSPCP